jgi:multidrug resistance efflux pump
VRKVSRFIALGLLLCILILLVGALALAFGRMDETVEARGAVVPAKRIGVSSEIGGIIREVAVREGDRVRVADTIFVLASDDLEYQVERAELTLAETKGRLIELNEEYANLTTSESFEGSAVLGDINAARKRMELTRINFERAEKLHEDDLLSEEERDAAKLSYDLALSNYRVLEARKSMLAEQYVRRIQEAESAVDLAEQAHELAARRLRRAVVTAPVSGTILTPNTDWLMGTMASPGQAIIYIGDLTEMVFVADVSEKDISKVRKGLDCRIFINAFPHRQYKVFEGNVMEIASVPKATSAGAWFETRIGIDEPWVEESDSRMDLRPGLSGRAEIVVEPDVRIIKIILEGIAK